MLCSFRKRQTLFFMNERRRRAVCAPPGRTDTRLPLKAAAERVLYAAVRRHECIWVLYNGEKCFAGVAAGDAIHKKSTEQSRAARCSGARCPAPRRRLSPGLRFSQWSTSVRPVCLFPVT